MHDRRGWLSRTFYRASAVLGNLGPEGASRLALRGDFVGDFSNVKRRHALSRGTFTLIQ